MYHHARVEKEKSIDHLKPRRINVLSLIWTVEAPRHPKLVILASIALATHPDSDSSKYVVLQFFDILPIVRVVLRVLVYFLSRPSYLKSHGFNHRHSRPALPSQNVDYDCIDGPLIP